MISDGLAGHGPQGSTSSRGTAVGGSTSRSFFRPRMTLESPSLVVKLEDLVLGRLAQVGVQQQGAVAGLGQRDGQVAGGRGLAVAGRGRGDQDRLEPSRRPRSARPCGRCGRPRRPPTAAPGGRTGRGSAGSCRRPSAGPRPASARPASRLTSSGVRMRWSIQSQPSDRPEPSISPISRAAAIVSALRGLVGLSSARAASTTWMLSAPESSLLTVTSLIRLSRSPHCFWVRCASSSSRAYSASLAVQLQGLLLLGLERGPHLVLVGLRAPQLLLELDDPLLGDRPLLGRQAASSPRRLARMVWTIWLFSPWMPPEGGQHGPVLQQFRAGLVVLAVAGGVAPGLQVFDVRPDLAPGRPACRLAVSYSARVWAVSSSSVVSESDSLASRSRMMLPLSAWKDRAPFSSLNFSIAAILSVSSA